MSNTGSGNKGDEIVSLEDLLKSDGMPSAPGATPSSDGTKAAGVSAKGAPYQNPIDIDLARVDALLDAEDPTFITKVQELRKEKLTGDIESDSFDDAEFDLLERRNATDTPPPPQPEGPGLKDQLVSFVRQCKAIFKQSGGATGSSPGSMKLDAKALLMEKPKIWGKAAIARLKQGAASSKGVLKNFKATPWTMKLAYLGFLSLMALLVLVVTLMIRGRLLPGFEIKFVPTVAADADHAWTIGENEEWDDFYSPLRHPEHVVLLDKVVVNLRRSESSDENPMGYFEFYLELSSHDAAVEVSDRKAEVSDAVQRTAEAISYDEIITAAGKNKLKLVIRKNVNNILTQGRVRKVFYKSVILKP